MTARTPLVVAAVGVCLASTLTYLLMGHWTSQPLVAAVQKVGVVGTVLGVIVGALALIVGRLSDYREPASDEDFERVVARSEYLAEQGLAVEPDEDEFLA
jgi:hypothetical protein